MPKIHARRRRASTRRPFQLEALEDRRLLATFTVTNPLDTGAGSLRNAIIQANNNLGPDTIVFDANIGNTVQVTYGQMPIAGPVTIAGPGADRLTIQGNGNSRIFEINNGNVSTEIDVTIRGLTISGGSHGDTGGAILSFHENVTLEDSHITGNTARLFGGGVGAVYGSLTIRRTTISGNSATEGGGLSAFVGSGDEFELNNSTVSGNQAYTGGGVSISEYPGGVSTVQHSTISGNTASRDGGVLIYRGYTSLGHSIVAGNVALYSPDASTGLFARDSMIGDGSGSGLLPAPLGSPDAFNNYVGTPSAPVDPMLGPLTDNGGPTPTHALQPGSPAIDSGSLVTYAYAYDTDQRGMLRVIDGTDDGSYWGYIDRGAVEYAPPVALIVSEDRDFVDGRFFDGQLSLREAIQLSNVRVGAETISFDSLLHDDALYLYREVRITDHTTIAGHRGGQRIGGIGTDRVIHIDDQNPNQHLNVSISDVHIQGGNAIGAGLEGGGGIFSREHLTLNRSTISGNTALFGGGLSHFGGNLTILNSTFYSNVASGHGGGLQFSMFAGTTAMLDNTTVSYNFAGEAGGGISSFSSGGQVTVRYSTLLGNQTDGDGIGGGGLGILNGNVSMLNSIVAHNTDASQQAPDATAGLDAAYTLIGDNTGSLIAAGNPNPDANIVGTGSAPIDPRVGALVDNGGTTPTHAPLAYSPVIGQGTLFSILGPSYDQRGAPFNRISGARPDLGAVEFIDSLSLLVTTKDDELDPVFDAADLSLREALEIVPHVDSATILFDVGGAFATPQTVALTMGELEIAGDVDILGPGADQLTIDAQDTSRVMRIGGFGPPVVELRGMTITGGSIAGNGGGIRNTGRLTLRDSRVEQNRAIGSGFQQGRGGGISNTYVTVLIDSVVTGNTGTAGGGGIESTNQLGVYGSQIAHNFSNNGGGLFVYGTAYVRDSLISGNSAADGGGANLRDGFMLLRYTTVNGNLASSHGGGLRVNTATYATFYMLDSIISANDAVEGGGVALEDATGLIFNSTVSGNSASLGAGVQSRNSSLTVRHSTLTQNSATTAGGGVQQLGVGSFTISDSIVAQNTGAAGPDVNGSVTAAFSLIGHNGGSNLAEAAVGMPDPSGNLVGGPVGGEIDARLGPLMNHGGVTETHALLAGSPALNQADPSFQPNVTGPQNDQRGFGFDRVHHGRLDMGSYESLSVPMIDGDFNDDGVYDCDDIDALIHEIATATHAASFDLTGDGQVTTADRDAWLAEAGAANLTSGNPFLLGDANLDGNVDGQDFVIWNNHKFTANGGWCGADFNADGVTNGQDFVIWNNQKFTAADTETPSARGVDSLTSAADGSPRSDGVPASWPRCSWSGNSGVPFSTERTAAEDETECDRSPTPRLSRRPLGVGR